MTDMETLQECRMAAMEERALAKQIERLAMIGAPRGIASQAIKPGADRKTNNSTSAQMQQLEGLIERLENKREENIMIIQQAENVIERIRERKRRVLIRLYYVEGPSDYEVAREMDMSAKWIQQLRNKIIEKL